MSYQVSEIYFIRLKDITRDLGALSITDYDSAFGE